MAYAYKGFAFVRRGVLSRNLSSSEISDMFRKMTAEAPTFKSGEATLFYSRGTSIVSLLSRQ